MGAHTPSWLHATAAVDCSLAGRYHGRRDSISSLYEAELGEQDSSMPAPYFHPIVAATALGHNSIPNPPPPPSPRPHPRPGPIPPQPQPPTPPDVPTPPRSPRQRPSCCTLAVLDVASLLDSDGEFPWMITYPTPRPPPSPRPYPRPGPVTPYPPPGTLTPPPSP